MTMDFFSAKPKPEFNWHEDDALRDQTPETRSILAGLGDDSKALIGLIAGGRDEAAKRKAVASLPLNDRLSKFFLAKGVSHYYNSMLHPPLSYRGPTSQYRSPDGSHHSFLNPELGKAGQPYAKSVMGTTAIHGARPDPGDLFDMLLARDPKKVNESQSGLSSMLLYHATIIIHGEIAFRANDGIANNYRHLPFQW